MRTLLPYRGICGVGLALGLGFWAVATAQPSRLPPPETVIVSPLGESQSAADGLSRADFSLKQREDRLAALLDRSVADGSLGHREHARASAGLAAIRAAENRMRLRKQGADADTFRLEGHIKTPIAYGRWKRRTPGGRPNLFIGIAI
jgi:hypothetical protein